MSSIGPKSVRFRLDPLADDSLRQHVLRRDGWRCQSCGTMSNLEVHHKQFRSHSGQDSEENLITLCRQCHDRIHRGNGDCANRSSCLSPRIGKMMETILTVFWA
jgi:phage terminase large subunit GpA-like protein